MNDLDSINLTFEKVWETVTKRNKKGISKVLLEPKAFVLGGQPGAGKSGLIEKAKNICRDNILVISGDDFRKFHLEYEKFQKEYGKDSPKYTAKYIGMMTEAVLNKAIKEHYNIVIEGTFRTSETPIKTLSKLKENGYKTQVMIQTCSKELSWKSCQERYEKMLEVLPKEARWTDKNHHDLVCENLAQNIKVVYNSGFADKTEIYYRDETGKNEKIYSSDNKIPPNIRELNSKIGIKTSNQQNNKKQKDFEIER